MTPLLISVWKGYHPIVSSLLKSGADPNIPDNKDRTPLYFAVRRNDINVLQILLDFKADPNVNVKQQSLLSIASKNGCAESVMLLLKYGADIDAESEIHPLESVLKSGSKICLSILLSQKSYSMFQCFPNGKNLLEQALESKSSLLPVVAYLAKKEIDEQKNNKKDLLNSFSKEQKKEIENVLLLNEKLIEPDLFPNLLFLPKRIWKM